MIRSCQHRTAAAPRARRSLAALVAVALVACALALSPRAASAAPPPGLSPAKEQQGLRVVSELFSAPVNPFHDGKCFIWGDRSVLVTADTTEAALWQTIAALPDPGELPRYVLGNRWTSTATNPSVPFRRPFTLTYSFVPDGTIAPDLSGNPGGSTLFATFTAAFGSEAAWRSRFGQYLTEWGNLTGVMYVEVSDDGAAFGSSGSNSGSIRGDLRFACRPLDGGSNTLAFNFFPGGGQGGDMVLDSADAGFFALPNSDFRRFRNTVMHEHGHGIGMAHVDPINNTKLMEAFLATNFAGPQQDDIRGSQRNYGDDREANDTVAEAFPLGLLPVNPEGPFTPVVLQNVALEDNGLMDVYSFEAREGYAVSITVTPVGSTYLSGTQGGSTSNVFALSIHDLAFDLISTDGTTTLQAVNSNAVGLAETLTAFDLFPGAGTYFVRVRTPSSTDDIQRYTLSVNVIPGSDTPILTFLPEDLVVNDAIANGNGALEPGESGVELTVAVQNTGTGTATNPTATLEAVSPTAFVVQGASTYPSIGPAEEGTNATPFVVGVDPSHVCGEAAVFMLTLNFTESSSSLLVEIPTGFEVQSETTTPATDVPVNIPNSTTVTSTITLASGGTIGNVIVRDINVTHTGVGDLIITVISPFGTEVNLMNRDGGNGDNLVNTTFDDAAGAIISGGSPPFTGAFRPRGTLSSFIGEQASGTWTLRVEDADTTDTGALTGWSLELSAGSRECEGASVITSSMVVR